MNAHKLNLGQEGKCSFLAFKAKFLKDVLLRINLFNVLFGHNRLDHILLLCKAAIKVA